MDKEKRIVVTGLGSVTPFGSGVDEFWKGLISGRSAIHASTDSNLAKWAPVAGEALSFNALDYMDKRLARKTDRFSQLALAAASEALHDAGLMNTDALAAEYKSDRIGIAMGCAFGGVRTLEAGMRRLAAGAHHAGPRMVPESIPNAAAALIARSWKTYGPVITYSTACASSANAIGEASYWLRLGEADMVITGGTECLFSPAILAGLRSARALATSGPEDPARWSRPFDADRRGMVMGEGSGVLILEDYQHALRRGAKIYAEFSGYGTSCDAYHETAPDPAGNGAALAIRRALNQAGVCPSRIDYINAHATATKAGDAAESLALNKVFGSRLDKIPVSSIKGAIGHLLGAAGAVESIACVKALKTGILPPTINCEHRDELAPSDIIPDKPRKQAIDYAMSNSFGFGGQNGVLIWKNAPEAE
jgi:3-oxoacyl-(acyl-carrier-protein) synthase